MSKISVEEFDDKVDSLYRLVILAGRRATQVAKPEVRPLVPVRSKKSTITALEEILKGKVGYTTTTGEDEEFVK